MAAKISQPSQFDIRIDALQKAPASPFAARALYEARYLRELTKVDKGKWNDALDKALSALEAGLASDGVLTDGAGKKAEDAMLPASGAAKRYNLICVGHAHIDMNWMWRYDETVTITLDTFRTVLDLMHEYPDFRFSQSQASVYEIVERFDPDMLGEIRSRVASGQWEVAASTWVEADKNMPSGESVARHLLYTRRYLTQLLGVNAEDLNLDFEPDTFGHAATVPETLAQGGIKYYYHCRGDEGEMLYRWRAPSGAELLCYREPFWYLGGISPDYALYTPAFCELYGTDVHMRVYGIGDHGGGPTRRDIEILRDMAQWPVFPAVRFGTYKEFYEAASKSKKLTVYDRELNSIFTGCYTSQSRIKQANRYGEAKLHEAEYFAAQSKLRAGGRGGRYPRDRFEQAWRNILFNQFHDILPGSCVIDSREHAMGMFSEAVAASDTEQRHALRMLGELADTYSYRNLEETVGDIVDKPVGGNRPADGNSPAIVATETTTLTKNTDNSTTTTTITTPTDTSTAATTNTTSTATTASSSSAAATSATAFHHHTPTAASSEGAGAGFGVGHSMAGMPNTHGLNNPQPFRISQVNRGRGLNRIYHIFNPSPAARKETVELTLFDWPGDLRRLTITGSDGKRLRHQIVDTTPKQFWGHTYIRILVEIELPPGGRHTCVLTQSDRLSVGASLPKDPRVEQPHEYILENEYLKAEFCPDSGTLLSLIDKEKKTELVAGPAAIFRIIDEQPAENTAGTAWTVGRYRALSDMSADIRMSRVMTGSLKNAIVIEAQSRSSKVTYTVSLAAGARWLDFDCDVDWREVGVPDERTQQLSFSLPIETCIGGFLQDIPGGLLERPSVNQDVPCQSFSAARYMKDRALMLINDSTYGFRCETDERYGYITMNLDCLRSSSDPDPYPEFGRHHFRIGIGISGSDGVSLLNTSYKFCHPASVVSDYPRKGGGEPMRSSGIDVTGAFLQAVKLAENSTPSVGEVDAKAISGNRPADGNRPANAAKTTAAKAAATATKAAAANKSTATLTASAGSIGSTKASGTTTASTATATSSATGGSSDLILRFVEPNVADSEIVATLWADIKSAIIVDTHEKPIPGAPLPEINGRMLHCPIHGGSTLTLRLTIE